jgi:hypothetical protein
MNFKKWSAALGAALELQGYKAYYEGRDAFTKYWSKTGGNNDRRVEIANLDPEGGTIYRVHYTRRNSDQTGEVFANELLADPDTPPDAVTDWLRNQP